MAKYIYGNTLTAFETAKSSDVAAELQKVETATDAEETRTNDSIKFPAGEGNDIRITENPAQCVDTVLGFGSSGEIVLTSGLTASVTSCTADAATATTQAGIATVAAAAAGVSETNAAASEVAAAASAATLLNTAVFEIGTWDMDATSGVVVSPSPIGKSQIRAMSAFIRVDDDAVLYDFSSGVGESSQSMSHNGAGVFLTRLTGGIFDNANFDTMSGDGNRGFIVVQYVD